MTKVYCLYWVPGSGGDMIQQIIGMHPDWYTGSQFILRHNGRVVRKMDQDFVSVFPSKPDQWLWREWSSTDLDRLLSWGSKNIVIGTHSFQELVKIKSYLGDRVTTIGITYNETLYPAVVKNFCTKVANTDAALNQIYKKQHPALYKKLHEKNSTGLLVLKDCLKNQNIVPLNQTNAFDIELRLEKIFLGDLQWVNQCLTDQSAEHLSAWLSLQDPLYRTAISANNDYIKCLGINTEAITQESAPIELNTYHQILIKHHFPQAPRFKTHTEFKYFTENTINDNYKATL